MLRSCQDDSFCNSCTKMQSSSCPPRMLLLRAKLFDFCTLEALTMNDSARRSCAPAAFPRTLARLILTIGVLLCFALAGCHHAPHSVTLKWDAPVVVSGKISSYNIYRSTTSGGPFVKLASGVPAPPYEDRLVNSGRTYFYVVTALDQTGRESRFSNEVRAEIP